MADRLIVTGSGDPLAADQVADIIYPKTKIALGGPDEAVDLRPGPQAQAESLPVVIAPDQAAVDMKSDALAFYLRQILQHVSLPLWINASQNALQVVGSGGTITTVTAVTTLTNQTQIGGANADPMVPAAMNNVWANAIRSILS